MKRLILAVALGLISACSGSDSVGPEGVVVPGELTYSTRALHVTPPILSFRGSADGTLIGGGFDGLVPMRQNGQWALQALDFPRDAFGRVENFASRTNGAFVLDANHAWLTADETVYHFENGEWRTEFMPDTGIGGDEIFAFGPDDIWVAGLRSLHHFNGAAWSRVEMPFGTVVRGLGGAQDGTIFVAGDEGVLLRGTSSGLQVIDTKTTSRLRAIFAVSASRAIVVGDDGTSLSLTGSTITDLPTGEDGRLTAVHGTSIASVFAAGSNGVFLRFDGDSWSRMPNTGAPQVTGLFVARGDEIYAGTIERGVIRFDGTSWSTEFGADERVVYRSSFVLPTGEGWFVGNADNQGFVTQIDAGGNAIHETLAGLVNIGAVWAASPTDVWAAGTTATEQRLLHFDGTDWDVLPSPLTASPTDMWGNAPDDIFLVGGEGAIAHFDGSVWREMDSGTSVSLRAVMGTASDRVFAAGRDGVLLEFNGERWVDIPSPTATGFADLWVDERGLLLLSFSSLHVQTDSGFVEMPREASPDRRIWRSPEGAIFGVGFDGNLVRLVDGQWEFLTELERGAPTYETIYGVNDGRIFAGGVFALMEITGQ